MFFFSEKYITYSLTETLSETACFNFDSFASNHAVWHSLENHLTVLSCGAVCFVIQCGSNFVRCDSNHAV